jgi:hypothetical protein
VVEAPLRLLAKERFGDALKVPSDTTDCMARRQGSCVQADQPGFGSSVSAQDRLRGRVDLLAQVIDPLRSAIAISICPFLAGPQVLAAQALSIPRIRERRNRSPGGAWRDPA